MATKTNHNARRIANVLESLEGRTFFSAAEPNNTFAQAFTPSNNIYLEQNLVDTDSVSTTSDTDDYRKFYNLYGKSHLYAALNGLSADADLYVYDQNQNLLASSTQGGNNSETINVDLAGNQYFYVRVRAFSGATNYGLYLYNDYSGATQATARDNGISWGQTSDKYYNYNKLFFEDYLDFRDNVDFVKFQMEAPGTISIRMKDFTYTGNLVARMQLLDVNGNVLADTSGTVGNGLNFDRISLNTGTYFVKFTQISGSDPYTFRIVSDYAGDRTATARNLGDLTGSSRQMYDMVGGPFGLPTYEDATDLYKFTLTQTAPLNVQLQIGQGLTPPTFDADLKLARDTNGDGFIQSNEVFAQSALSGTDRLSTILNPGTYYAVVDQHGAYTSYQLDLNSDFDGVLGVQQAYNDLSRARNAGTLAGEKVMRDGFGVFDTADYTKFTMGVGGTFTAIATKEFKRYGEVYLSVVRDINANGRFDPGETIANGTNVNGVARVTANLPAGTYYVYAGSNGQQTGYALRLISDYAGGTLALARNVGPLTSTAKVFNDYIEQSGPGADNSDVYRFTIASTKNVFATTTGSPGKNAVLQLIRDANNNGVLDAGEVLAASDNPNSANESITRSLTAGTYFVRMAGVAGATNYALSLRTN
jgi:hypothetical protein